MGYFVKHWFFPWKKLLLGKSSQPTLALFLYSCVTNSRLWTLPQDRKLLIKLTKSTPHENVQFYFRAKPTVQCKSLMRKGFDKLDNFIF